VKPYVSGFDSSTLGRAFCGIGREKNEVAPFLVKIEICGRGMQKKELEKRAE
jgi:hypothetical protein